MTKDAEKEENERERDGFQGKAYGHPGKTGNHGTTQTAWRDKHNHLVDNRMTAWRDTRTIFSGGLGRQANLNITNGLASGATGGIMGEAKRPRLKGPGGTKRLFGSRIEACKSGQNRRLPRTGFWKSPPNGAISAAVPHSPFRARRVPAQSPDWTSCFTLKALYFYAAVAQTERRGSPRRLRDHSPSAAPRQYKIAKGEKQHEQNEPEKVYRAMYEVRKRSKKRGERFCRKMQEFQLSVFDVFEVLGQAL